MELFLTIVRIIVRTFARNWSDTMKLIFAFSLLLCFLTVRITEAKLSNCEDMLVFYRMGSLYFFDPVRGTIVESMDLKLSAFDLSSQKLSIDTSGRFYITDRWRSRRIIYRLEIENGQLMRLVEFAEGLYPMFLDGSVLYFSKFSNGFRLLKLELETEEEPVEIHPGPFFPASTFQGVDRIGFYDYQNSDYFEYTHSSGLIKLEFPDDYSIVGTTDDDLYVCYSHSVSGTHYVDKSGALVRTVEHIKRLERPLFFDQRSGLLVIDRTYAGGFLWLEEHSESYLVVGDTVHKIPVGPLSVNSIVSWTRRVVR